MRSGLPSFGLLPPKGAKAAPESVAKTAAAAAARLAAIRAMGLPEKKKCRGCEQWKPSNEYHLRKQKTRAGETYYVLRPRCKACTQREFEEYKERYIRDHGWDAWVNRNRKYGNRHRSRRRQEKKRPDRRVPVEPLAGFLREHPWPSKEIALAGEVDEALIRRLRNGGGSKTYVMLSVVDQIGVGLRQPGLVALLYPELPPRAPKV